MSIDRGDGLGEVHDPGADDPTARALRRMDAARAEIRRRYFSDEAWAIPFPADAPEVVGVHTPDVIRREFRHRATG